MSGTGGTQESEQNEGSIPTEEMEPKADEVVFTCDRQPCRR